MRTIIKRVIAVAASCAIAMVTPIAAAAATEAQAATGMVRDYTDMIGQGGYIYYIKSPKSGEGASSIYRMKVSTGNQSRVVDAENGIVDMAANGNNLYYTTSNDKGEWEVWTCLLNGGDAQYFCDGRVCCADSESVYCIKYVDGARPRLYCRDLLTGQSTSIKTAKPGQGLDYVGSIGNDSYYYLYDGKKDKIYLYLLNRTTKKLIRIVSEKRVVKDAAGAMLISDIEQINGELYYNFGSYEGSGGFWNGSIRKLTVDGKKKTVAKTVSGDRLINGSRELYFETLSGNYYKYNLKSGKKTKYSLEFQKDISYTILGDKTYMADTSDKKKVVISRFNSGTRRETLTRNFISIPFKQKSNISYSVHMKQVGIYNMVYIVGIDFTDSSYGWRGKLVSTDWFITDGSGTVLGNFH